MNAEDIRKALSSRRKKTIVDPGLADAGVLIPLYYKENKYHIVFTRRSDHLTNHKGQVAFPGGGHHAEDKSLMHTALRESREEIGLKESDVEILGELDDCATATSRYRMVPYVGLIPYPYKFKKDDFEVADIFDLPLDDLITSASRKEESIIYDQTILTVVTIELQGKTIWGATGRILGQLLDLLKPVSGAHTD